jgi:hypothetical protein
MLMLGRIVISLAYERIRGLDVNLFFAIVEIVLLAVGLALISRVPKTAPAAQTTRCLDPA